MASRSASAKWRVLCSTTSAIAPKAATLSVRPVFRNNAISAGLQDCRPCASPRRLLARQPSITAPIRKASPSAIDSAFSW